MNANYFTLCQERVQKGIELFTKHDPEWIKTYLPYFKEKMAEFDLGDNFFLTVFYDHENFDVKMESPVALPWIEEQLTALALTDGLDATQEHVHEHYLPKAMNMLFLIGFHVELEESESDPSTSHLQKFRAPKSLFYQKQLDAAWWLAIYKLMREYPFLPEEISIFEQNKEALQRELQVLNENDGKIISTKKSPEILRAFF